MFSKAKETEGQGGQSSQQARRMIKSAPSIISTDMVVQGSLIATGDIQVDGRVEGDIESGSLTIGEKATVHGEISCEEVIIRGRVIGSVRASRVHLAGTSHVEGDIFHQALAVETGAFFEGNCRHSDNPVGESGSRRKKGGVKNLLGDADADMPSQVASNGRGNETTLPKPSRRGGRGRSPVEAQSALSRLTGGSSRKNQD
jgi:cytoskeletal protein CcmA (bactofilin family)